MAGLDSNVLGSMINAPAAFETSYLQNQAAQQENQYRPQLLQNQVSQGQADIQGKQLANQAASMQNLYAQHNLEGQLLNSVNDQQSYDVAKQIAAKSGLDTSSLPQQYDPAVVAQHKQNWLNADQQLKLLELNTQTGGMLLGNLSMPQAFSGLTGGNSAANGASMPSSGQTSPSGLPLNPVESQAKAIIQGLGLPPTGRAAESGIGLAVNNMVRQLDPNFDFTNPHARADTAKDFSSAGKSGQSINAINTVIGHLQTLSDQADALHNTSFPVANAIKNFVSVQTGNDAVTNFDATKKAVADELTKVWRQSGGAEADIQDKLKSLNDSSSPKQLQGVIKDFGDLLSSKLSSLASSYQSTMGGTVPPKGILQADKAAFLNKLGVDTSDIPQINMAKGAPPNAGVPQTQNGSNLAPEGTRIYNQQGQALEKRNGKWMVLNGG